MEKTSLDLLREVMYASESETLTGAKAQAYEQLRRRLKAYSDLTRVLNLHIETEKIYQYNEYLGVHEVLYAGDTYLTSDKKVLEAFRGTTEEGFLHPSRLDCGQSED